MAYFLLSFLVPISLLAFPTKNWPDISTKYKKQYPNQVVDLENYVYSKNKNNKWDTNSFLIIKDGKIIYESYKKGFTKDSKQLSWSVSKSFINALYGIAVHKNMLEMNHSVCKYDSFPTQQHCSIRLKDLLEFKSGLDWKESYEKSKSVTSSSVLSMLYGQGRKKMYDFSKSHNLKINPGVKRVYSSGDSNILSGLLKQYLKEDYENFIWRELFDPLGIKNLAWEQDSDSVFIASSYVYISARDLARFGYLYMNDGVWQNHRILPIGWVKYTRSKASPHFWVQLPQAQSDPTDAFAAKGHWGQLLLLIPSENLLFVRFAADKEQGIPLMQLIRQVRKYAGVGS